MTTDQEPLMTTAPPDEIFEAIEAVDLEAPWETVAPSLRPLLPRRRPLPGGVEDLVVQTMPPGIDAGLGLDIGPAMLFVATAQLDAWGVSAEVAFERAMDNIRTRLAAHKHYALMHERIGDVPTTAFQSREGWASSLLLMPQELARVFGSRDALILAPMRDLVLTLPLDSDPEFAYYLLEQFAAEDMNALDLPPFALVGGRLGRAVATGTDHRARGRHSGVAALAPGPGRSALVLD